MYKKSIFNVEEEISVNIGGTVTVLCPAGLPIDRYALGGVVSERKREVRQDPLLK